MSADAVLSRSGRVEHCMGTLVTIDLRDPGAWDEASAAAMAWLHRVDGLFSTFRPDSELSRVRRGELRLEDADPLLAEVAERCAELEAATGGAFSATFDGRFDPTGLVKGWAVERASAMLRAAGSHNHAVNGGGDMQLAGQAAPGRPWRVGVSDPGDATRLLATIAASDCAVATSGLAARGRHIVDPRTGALAAGLASVTVVGPSLAVADAYATAAVVMGAGALAWLESRPGYEGLVVARGGTARPTSGWATG